MINRFIDKLFSLFDNFIEKANKLSDVDVKPNKEREKKFKELDRIIENKSIEDEKKEELLNQKEKNFQDIMRSASIELQNKVEIFNSFLEKYNLKFGKVSSPFYEINGNVYADSNVHSDMKGLKNKVSLIIHFNQNEEKIYTDFKDGKLKFQYDLWQLNSSYHIVSTNDFDVVLKEFVEYYKGELKNKIKND